MTRAPTLSGLGLVAACPGSLRLRRTRRDSATAAMGRAIHEVCEREVTTDATEDAAAIAERHGLDPDDAGRLAFIANHLALPVPANALCEVSLGLFPDGSVRRIEGGAGDYSDVGQILSGQLDCMWAEPGGIQEINNGDAFVVDYASTLWVIDVKTGDEDNVPPPERNWQLRGAAVMAARWTGAARVAVAICYVNAADCAAAVRAGAPYQGRWEGAGPLAWDATEGRHVRRCVVWNEAKLAEIETELRAVLARARGESDGTPVERLLGGPWSGVGVAERRDGSERGERRGDDGNGPAPGGPGPDVHRRYAVPLILGPHCEWCDAQSACPAFAAEALNLLRELESEDAAARPKTGPEQQPNARAGSHPKDADDCATGHGSPQYDTRPGLECNQQPAHVGACGQDRDDRDESEARSGDGGRLAGLSAMTTARAARLAGIIPAMRRALDSAEAAVKAHVRAHGPLRLADGREYGPVIESVTKYTTAPTFLALAEVVGDEKANEAFSASKSSIERALEAQPSGAWSRLRKELEARGAVMARTREVWTRKYPALPVEVSDDVQEVRREPRDGGVPNELHEGVAGQAGDQDDPAFGERGQGGDRNQPHGEPVHGSAEVCVRGDGVHRPVTRAACPACGVPHIVMRAGLRAHFAPGTKLRCNQRAST